MGLVFAGLQRRNSELQKPIESRAAFVIEPKQPHTKVEVLRLCHDLCGKERKPD